jgi:hypothetical protein
MGMTCSATRSASCSKRSFDAPISSLAWTTGSKVAVDARFQLETRALWLKSRRNRARTDSGLAARGAGTCFPLNGMDAKARAMATLPRSTRSALYRA